MKFVRCQFEMSISDTKPQRSAYFSMKSTILPKVPCIWQINEAKALFRYYPMLFYTSDIFANLIRKSKDYVYGIWVYKALGIWKGYYRVKKNHWFRTWNREQRQEIINIWNITPNLHTNSHFEMWAEKWTIMQEASGSSTAPNAARRISC